MLTSSQTRLLSEARVGHLATSDPQGQPHVIPVCFALHEGNLYSVLDQKPKRAPLTRLRRVRNILANPTAALIVDHYQEDWQGLWYILVWGPAGLLIEGDESEDERAAAVDVLRRKYQQYREMDIADNPVVKLTPERVAAWGGDGAPMA